MAIAKPKHIHKYQKVKWGKKKTEVFRCVLVGCPHYVHPEMAFNRQSLCHKCGKPFVMTRAHLEVKKPVCMNCVRHRDVEQDPALDKLDDLLRGL